LQSVIEHIFKNTDWLYIKILGNSIFFFDFWSFVHLWSSAILITIIVIAKFRHKWSTLFAFLLFYEIAEIILRFAALKVFMPETIKDQFTDILVGMAGGYLFHKWLEYYSTKKKHSNNFLLNYNTHIALLTAFTIAFLWVGFYGYKYNVPVLNFSGFNYAAFSFWSLGIFLILVTYNYLTINLGKHYSMILVWIIYFIILCIIEYILYHLFGFRESGQHVHKPLIFDIIHGTKVLHIFYLLVPFISVAVYTLVKKYIIKAFHMIREFNGNLDFVKNNTSNTEELTPL